MTTSIAVFRENTMFDFDEVFWVSSFPRRPSTTALGGLGTGGTSGGLGRSVQAPWLLRSFSGAACRSVKAPW